MRTSYRTFLRNDVSAGLNIVRHWQNRHLKSKFSPRRVIDGRFACRGHRDVRQPN